MYLTHGQCLKENLHSPKTLVGTSVYLNDICLVPLFESMLEFPNSDFLTFVSYASPSLFLFPPVLFMLCY